MNIFIHCIQKSNTAVQTVKDHPQSSAPPRPVTMPVTTQRSPESQFRSSSSSYHSASNYDEPEDHSMPPYHANVERPIPHTLVKSARRDGATSSSSPRGSFHSSKGGLTASSEVPDDLSTRYYPSSLRTPGLRPHSAVSSRGSGTGSGRHSPDEELVQEFREAVKAWNVEAVERVLIQDRGVDVDMIIREKVLFQYLL